VSNHTPTSKTEEVKKTTSIFESNDTATSSEVASHDFGPGVMAFKSLQAAADDSSLSNSITQLQAIVDDAANNDSSGILQLQAMADARATTLTEPIQRQENNTGLPDNLKSGMENLSGYSMDDVKVHRNSAKPAQLQAHAYAQGTDIHLGPGQEKHLPHELGHVVQQKQGRVKPTMQMKRKVNINDDTGLEKEADVMGAKALQLKTDSTSVSDNKILNPVFQREVLNTEGLNSELSAKPEEESVLSRLGEGTEKAGSGFETAETGMGGYKVKGEKDPRGEVKSDGFDQASGISAGVTSVIKVLDDFVKLYNADDKWENLKESGLVEDVATSTAAIANIVKVFSGEGEDGGDATMAASITDTISKAFSLTKQAYHLVKDPYDAQQTETAKWWSDPVKVASSAKALAAAAASAAGIAKNAYEMVSDKVPPALATAMPAIDIVLRTVDVILSVLNYYGSEHQIVEDTERQQKVREKLDTIAGKDKVENIMRDYPAGNYGLPFLKDNYRRPTIALMKEVNSRDKGELAGDMGWTQINSVLGANHDETKYRAFSEAIREYELADKLTEINQKKKVSSVKSIFEDFAHIAADILTLTASPASIVGLIIKTGLSAGSVLMDGGEYIQDAYREQGDEEAQEHSKKGKNKKGADHAKTVVGMYVKAKALEGDQQAETILTAESYIRSSGLNVELLNKDKVDKRAEKMTAAFAGT